MVQLWATSKTTAHSRQQVALVPAPSPRGQPPSPQPAPNHLILWGAAPGGRPQVILGGVFRNPDKKWVFYAETTAVFSVQKTAPVPLNLDPLKTSPVS